MSRLPPPRRLVSTQDPNGAPIILDDQLAAVEIPDKSLLAQAYVQSPFIPDPKDAIKGTGELKPDQGWIRSDGVNVGFLDFPPGYESPMHFTNTYDYLVVLNGEVELFAWDGTSKVVRAGDLVVQCAAAHKWANKSDQWARVVALVTPALPAKVQGRTLDEEPVKALDIMKLMAQ